MKDFDVVGLGALNVDHFFRVERILEDGEAVTKGFARYAGGSAANTVHGLARLGMSTGFIGAVGDDDDGRLLLRAFSRAGVDTSRVAVKPRAGTGSVLCLSDEAGGRALYVTPGANSLLAAGDVDISYLGRARVLHLATFVGERQFEVSLEAVKNLPRGVELSFGPGSLYAARGMKALAPILKKTSVLFINHEELRTLTGRSLKAGASLLERAGCRLVVVTLGAGVKLGPVNAVCYIRTGDREEVIEALTAKAGRRVDTTGAGDAFAAGHLFGMLKGKSPLVCGRLGYLVALSAISKMGARRGLPTLAQLSARYQALYGEKL